MARPVAKGPDLKVRLKSKLLGLDDRDLTAQAERELQKLVRQAASQAEVELLAKELLAGLDNAGTNAKRARIRCARPSADSAAALCLCHVWTPGPQQSAWPLSEDCMPPGMWISRCTVQAPEV